MRIPKGPYGAESKKNDCPFCGDFSISVNSQGIPVCLKHKETLIENFKCLCGDWLDVFSGKFGPYFRCMRCGNVNFKRGMEINAHCLYKRDAQNPAGFSAGKPQTPSGNTVSRPPNRTDGLPPSGHKKEVVIRSDELEFWTE